MITRWDCRTLRLPPSGKDITDLQRDHIRINDKLQEIQATIDAIGELDYKMQEMAATVESLVSNAERFTIGTPQRPPLHEQPRQPPPRQPLFPQLQGGPPGVPQHAAAMPSPVTPAQAQKDSPQMDTRMPNVSPVAAPVSELPVSKAPVAYSTFNPPVMSTDDSWHIPRKGTEDLEKFQSATSKPEVYKLWRERMEDHISTNNSQWAIVLEYVRRRPHPITKTELLNASHGKVQYWSMAGDLYKFLGKWIADNLFRKRSTLADGAGNGLRLWQRLFEDYEGGDILCDLDGRDRFMHFPSVERQDDLIDK